MESQQIEVRTHIARWAMRVTKGIYSPSLAKVKVLRRKG
jgi:hypothetical protein